MSISQRVKTSLDEARTLILGAQILLGFQYQGVFRARFEALSPGSRAADAGALALMLIAMGLLIALSAYHRIAEHGLSTGAMQRIAGRCVEASLLPFAVALGLDLAFAGNWAFGSVWAGAACGFGFTVLALLGWFGVGSVMKRLHGGSERGKAQSEQGKQEAGPLHSRIEQMLAEARVILPGAQAMLGFQLVIVLSSAFEKLPESSKTVHGASLLCVALAIIALVTPAALHRIVWAGEDSETFLHTGGRIVVAALLPLAFGMAGETYVVFTRIFSSSEAGLAAGMVNAVFLSGCWFAWPYAVRARRRATRQGARVSHTM